MKYSKLIALAVTLAASVASAAMLTNADIIKMSTAKLDDAIIVSAIENSEPKFDTSAQGLIELSAAKVPQAIITVMIKRNNSPVAPVSAPTVAVHPAAPTAATAADSELMSPSEILMIDGSETKSMRYLTPQVRSSARALGLGGFASYAVLRGSQASTRIANKQPGFLVSVPN